MARCSQVTENMERGPQNLLTYSFLDHITNIRIRVLEHQNNFNLNLQLTICPSFSDINTSKKCPERPLETTCLEISHISGTGSRGQYS